MIDVHIQYPAGGIFGDDEDSTENPEVLRAFAIPGLNGLAQLRQHSMFIPLAPLDVVRTEDREGRLFVTGVEHLEPLYTYYVSFHLPVDLNLDLGGKTIPVMEEWDREAYCTYGLDSVAYVSTASKEWAEEKVLKHPYVDFAEVIRTPRLKKIGMDVAVANASVADNWLEGPWA